MLNQIRNYGKCIFAVVVVSLKLRAVSEHMVKVKGSLPICFTLPSSLRPYPNSPQGPPHFYSQLEVLMNSATYIRHFENFVEKHVLRSNPSKIIGNDFSPYCAQAIQLSSLGCITLFIHTMKYKSDRK